MGLGQGLAWGKPSGQGKGRHKPPGHGPSSFGHALPNLEIQIALFRTSIPTLKLPPQILICPGRCLRLLEWERIGKFHLLHPLSLPHSIFCHFPFHYIKIALAEFNHTTSNEEAPLYANHCAKGFTYIIINLLYGPSRKILLVPF